MTGGARQGEEHGKDRTAKKLTKTLAEKLAKDLTGKESTKTLAEKLAKDINGSNSYPLVGPRPEEAPDIDHGTLGRFLFS